MRKNCKIKKIVTAHIIRMSTTCQISPLLLPVFDNIAQNLMADHDEGTSVEGLRAHLIQKWLRVRMGLISKATCFS